MPEWVDYVNYPFNFLPCVHMSKLYGDVARVTNNHFLPKDVTWVSGRKFEYDDMFSIKVVPYATKDTAVVPNMITTFIRMLNFIVFYMVAAWYFDNILSSNRGHAEPFYFFLRPTYWFKNCFKKYMTEK